MQLTTCYPGHGPTIDDHRALIAERLAFHADRLDRIAELVADGRTTRRSRSPASSGRTRSRRRSPSSSTWEVVGHLDILVNRGTVREYVDDLGHHHFRSKEAVGHAQR